MEVPLETWLRLTHLSLQIASRLRRERYGLPKIDGFISITIVIAREIWGCPVTGVPDSDIVEDVLVEIWQISHLVDNIIENLPAHNCFLYVIKVVFMNSFTAFDFLAVSLL